MKWKGKKDTFSDGELRTIQRFAWLPVKLSDFTWIWLEYYREDQKFWVPWLHGVFHWRIFPQFTTIRKYQW